MFSRKICTPVLVLGLSLGFLSELHALPPQGTRVETRIQQELSKRIWFQDLWVYVRGLMESNHGPGNDEGPGLCPNGGRGGRSGSGNGGSGSSGNGNGGNSGSGSGNG